MIHLKMHPAPLLMKAATWVGLLCGAAALANCGDDDAVSQPDAGTSSSSGSSSGGTSSSSGDSGPVDDGKNGPAGAPAANPNVHEVGNAANGKTVFRLETFGNESFWTNAAKLPQGITAKQLTPVQALQAGLSVDVDALDPATQKAVADEIKAMGTAGPLLNSFATTVKLINANAVIGVVAVDSDANGTIDIAGGGDKVGVSCALCHGITDNAVFQVPKGGSIGKRIDGPAVHDINIGAIFAMAANTRAFYPMAQLKGADGKSIGRAPSEMGLTKDSTEAAFDAYFSNLAFYPIGMFDDTVDGNGNPMHNTPMFRADLAAPWGTAGELPKLDHFSNTVYTALLDPTNILSPGGKAFLKAAAGAAGEKLAADYTAVLAADGVTGYPFVKVATTGTPGDPPTLLGSRVDNTKLLDMNAYLNSLPSPKGMAGDAAAVARGRAIFRSSGKCTDCHNVDQSKFVPPTIIDMKTIFPGDNPVVLAPRTPPAGPVSDTPNATFDDKTIVINATLRGLNRGTALPLLMDLARKPVFLHDNSVTTLDDLLNAARGPAAAHPFYIADATQRADMITYLKSLDDTSK